MIFYGGDPLSDYDRRDALFARAERRRPICSSCRETIWEDRAVEYRGKLYCESCEDEAWKLIREQLLTNIEEE